MLHRVNCMLSDKGYFFLQDILDHANIDVDEVQEFELLKEALLDG